ncbi:MAG: YmdB family metallophosphoesterase [Lentisphaeria bacterium]|nr:YmdB family metallophosphoesterase [Lentisphaeria bacterium]
MKILFVGDIVGQGGRRTVAEFVPRLREELGCEFCVANGENMAGGGGLTRRCLDELAGAGIDVFTAGDHVWDQREFANEIDKIPNVLRPANVFAGQPGRGFGVFPAANGLSVGVVSLLGRTFMNSLADCPFQAADRILADMARETPIIVIDFHAEATSEKTALGRYLDGRVSAVLGTHTHVPTADEEVFPGGTAFQCDVGMVGARRSILGRDVAPVLQRFSTGMPARFTVAGSTIRLCATVVTVGPDGRATNVQRLVRETA